MINKVILMGRLTADPELKQTSNGISICRFTVAVNRPYADKQTGERQSDFINVVAWRASADFVARYFSKGKMIIIEGSLRNNDYTDKNGVKHYSMTVLADSVTFGESKSAASGNARGQRNSAPSSPNNYGGYSQSAPYQSQMPQQNPVQPQPQQQSVPNESLQIGNLSDFEVLSDGDVPF